MLLRPALPKGRPRDPSQGVSRLARSRDAGSPAALLGDGNERNDKYGTANSRAAAQRTVQIARAAIRSTGEQRYSGIRPKRRAAFRGPQRGLFRLAPAWRRGTLGAEPTFGVRHALTCESRERVARGTRRPGSDAEAERVAFRLLVRESRIARQDT